MWMALIGLIIGILLGFRFPVSIPPELARYTAVGLLGILDSILGALRADLDKDYNQTIFLSGLIMNMLLGTAVTYLGDALALDLYLAVIIVFMLRIFSNISGIRYHILDKLIERARRRKGSREEAQLRMSNRQTKLVSNTKEASE